MDLLGKYGISSLDSEIGAIWLAAGGFQLVITILFLKRTRAIIPAIHALGFIFFLPALSVTNAILSGVSGCDTMGSLGAACGTTIYITLFLGATQLKSPLFSARLWIQAVRSIPGQWVVSGITFWFLIKGYLFSQYGLSAIRSVDLEALTGPQTTYAYWETILNTAAVILLQAAIFLGVMRIALRVERVWIGLAVVMALISQIILGEMDVGARRTVLALAITYFITRWSAEPDQWRRLIKEVMIGFCAALAFSIYYPYVRANLYDRGIQTKLLSGEITEVLSGTAELFVPNRTPVEQGQTTILREGPMEFLCRLTQKQWDRKQLTWGAVTGAALYIAIPRVLLEQKVTTEPDEVVAASYDLFPQSAYLALDLATSPLAQLQSDLGPIGWVLSALIYAFAFAFFSAVFISRKFSVLVRLLALGTLWIVVASPEATLTTVVSGARDFVLFSVLIELGRRGYIELRRGVIRASKPIEWERAKQE